MISIGSVSDVDWGWVYEILVIDRQDEVLDKSIPLMFEVLSSSNVKIPLSDPFK